VYTNDWHPGVQADTHSDALQPGFYAGKQVSVVVTSPPFELLDLAAPLLAIASSVVACVHVPGHWLASPPVWRQVWMQSLIQQGRVSLLMGLPRGPMGRKCAWLLVFGSSCIRHALLRPGSAGQQELLAFAVK